MGKVSITTNVDLQNYKGRITAITKAMEPLGIEIFSIPQNYEPRMVLDLPESRPRYDGKFGVLSREIAKEIGQEMKDNGIRRIQFHYPWQKTLLDMKGHDFALTVQFCGVILDESGAERLTINHHNCYKYPVPSETKDLDWRQRDVLMKMIQTQTLLAADMKRQMKSRCLLVAENNPAVSPDEDGKTGESLLDNTDMVAEDFIDRLGLDGTTLDYSHAWCVTNYFGIEDLPVTQPNMEWCRKYYNGVPESGRSMELFVRKVAPAVKWIHLTDEPYPFTHEGLHMGEGSIDFEECAALLEKYLTENTPATIEVKDGHTADGFKQILEQDHPFLKRHFG